MRVYTLLGDYRHKTKQQQRCKKKQMKKKEEEEEKQKKKEEEEKRQQQQKVLRHENAKGRKTAQRLRVFHAGCNESDVLLHKHEHPSQY